MAYRNKIYIALDYDEDKNYYNIMKAWKQNDYTNFNFYDAHEINNLKSWSSEETIKAKLMERLRNSKIFILLVGNKTKYKYKYVKWEIEQAIKRNLPIIVVNINKKSSIDLNLCPAILHDELALHIEFSRDKLIKAIDIWKDKHYSYKREMKKVPMILK